MLSFYMLMMPNDSTDERDTSQENKAKTSRYTSRRNVIKTAVTGASVPLLSSMGENGSVKADTDLNKEDDAFGTIVQSSTGVIPSNIVGAEDRAFYTAGNSVAAVDDQGEEIWQTSSQLDVDDTRSLRVTLAGSSVLVYNDTSGISENIEAYNVDTGDSIWQESFTNRIASIVTTDTEVYVVEGANINAIDAQNADLLWRQSPGEFDAFVTSTVIAEQTGTIAATLGNNDIVAYDVETGDSKWEVESTSSIAVRTDGSDIFIATDDSDASDVVVTRIAGETGETVWERRFEDTSFGSTGYGHFRVESGSVVVYTAVDENSGTLRTLEKSSGNTRWNSEFSADFPDVSRNRVSVANNLVIVGKYGREEIEVYNIENGEINWFAAVPEISGNSDRNPLVVQNGIIYHRNQASPGLRIWAVSIESEELLFEYEVLGLLTTGMLNQSDNSSASKDFLDDNLLVPSKEGSITAVDSSSGDEVWKVETGSRIYSADRNISTEVTVGLTRGGSVIAFDEASGESLWTANPAGVGDEGRFRSSVQNPVVVEDNTVAVRTVVPRAEQEEQLTVYELTTGEQQWTTAKSEDILEIGITNNHLVSAGQTFERTVEAYNLASGEISWSRNLEADFNASELLELSVGNTQIEILFEDTDEQLQVVSLEESTGETIWSESIEWDNFDISGVARGPDQIVYTDSASNRIIGISTEGTILWEKTGSFRTGGIIGEQYGYIDTPSNEMILVDATDGSELVRIAPSAEEPSIYSDNGNFYLASVEFGGELLADTIEIVSPSEQQVTESVSVASIDRITSVVDDRLYGTNIAGGFIIYQDPSAEIAEPDPRPDVTGNGNPATDTTGNSLLNDINGDGEFDIFDVQVLFNNLDSETVQANSEQFNFSGQNPDEVSIFDVQALFNSL